MTLRNDPEAGITCWACAGEVEAEVDEMGYVKCAACGLRFYPSRAAPRHRYDDSYFTEYRGGNYYATESLRRHEARVRLDLARAASEAGARDLLEVGSAAGFFLDEAQRRGWHPVGIEPAAGPAEYAREKFSVVVNTAFVEQVDLDSASFDAVCLWHTLEHIRAPEPVLHRLRELLRPGGALLVEVPNGSSVLARRLGAEWFALEPDVHVAQWTPLALRLCLERAGLDVRRVYTVPFLTYAPGARRRFPRRVWLAIRQRVWLRDPHPSGHELLRAVAYRPRASATPS